MARANSTGVGYETILAAYLGSRIDNSLPDRYRRLVEEVLLRLPEGWDERVEWSAEGSGEEHPPCYGSALRLEEDETDGGMQLWEVTLYPALLDRLSDPACCWVIAHEFAHVASGLPVGSVLVGGKPLTRIKGTVDQYQEAATKTDSEVAADRIALEWGFDAERQVFPTEDA